MQWVTVWDEWLSHPWVDTLNISKAAVYVLLCKQGVEHVRLGAGWRMVTARGTELKATLDQRGDALQPLGSADYIQAGSHSWGWVDLHLSEVFKPQLPWHWKEQVMKQDVVSDLFLCGHTELSMLNTDSLCNHNCNLVSNSIKSNKQHVTETQD